MEQVHLIHLITVLIHLYQVQDLPQLPQLAVAQVVLVPQAMQVQVEEQMADQVAVLHSPVMIDRRAKELNLGLAPAQPAQKIILSETVAVSSGNNAQPRQFASRPVVELTP